MTEAACHRLNASTASLGTVQGLELLTTQVNELARRLNRSAQLSHAELNELKRRLTIFADTICHLRSAVTLQLRALGVEKDNAG
jgi:hypothetical protein